MKRFLAILGARNKEFFRDRAAMGWNFLFPFLIILAFAYMFKKDGQELYKVGVLASSTSRVSDSPLSKEYKGFRELKYVKFVEISGDQKDEAIIKVEKHQYDLLVLPLETTTKYWVNKTSPKGYILEKLLVGSLDGKAERQVVFGKKTRYVDWLVPGLLAMNMMFSALFGVGYTLVRYRKNGVLKRLKATPLNAFEFLCAQLVSRLFLLMFVASIVYIGCHIIVGFTMNGSYLNLFLIFALGGVCLISMSLMVAARTASEELAGGLLNILSWPMMLLSGVWFSLEGMSKTVHLVADFFPLTHVISAARAIMNDGTSLSGLSFQVGMLLGMSALFLTIGAVTFKWND